MQNLKWGYGKAFTGSQSYIIVTLPDGRPVVDLMMPKETAIELSEAHNAALEKAGREPLA